MTTMISRFAKTIRTLPNPASLFYGAYCLYMVKFVIENSTIDHLGLVTVESLGSAIDCLVLLLLFVKFLNQKMDTKRFCGVLCLVIVGFVGWRLSAEGWFFWLVLFTACAKGVDFARIAKITFLTCLCSVVVISLMSLLGIAPSVVAYRGEAARTSMGFEHPNQLGLYLLLITTSYSAISFEAGASKVLLIFGLALLVNHFTCNSRTLAILLVAQACLFFLFKHVKSEAARKNLLKCFVALIASLVLISVYFLVFFDGNNPLHVFLDDLLSGRFYLANTFFKSAGISLLGCDYSHIPDVSWVGGERVSFLVDNGYLHCILRFGVIPSLLLCAGLILLFKQILANGRWDGFVYGLIVMLLFAVTETSGLKADNYYLVVGLASVLYRTEDAFLISNKHELHNAGNIGKPSGNKGRSL